MNEEALAIMSNQSATRQQKRSGEQTPISFTRLIALLVGAGVVWGVLIQLYRAYSPIGPDFVWLELGCLMALLAGLAFAARRFKPVQLGLLVTLFWVSVLIAHFAYYPLSLAFWQPRAQMLIDLNDPAAYSEMWGLFIYSVQDKIFSVEVGGFAVGWLWAFMVRRIIQLRRQRGA